ncbi:hypothetical protein [Agathobacter rectalis]|uniref:hypothetical protein n=1 Tax=Agathobacter rectalis TaxID=39491 RepID=UPI0027D329DD|nr:hypothetical protein [Agathobacter rectalis]MCB7108869.1 hypothetical protein [Agathobacter rectalis]MCG4812161.1 hypothetical protein [Agathobacter rectalis]
MNYTTIGILIGLGFAVFVGLDLLLQDYDFISSICAFLIVGAIFSTLCGVIGYLCDDDEKVNNTIKTTINTNYSNVVNFHNGVANQSFVSDGLKYTFDYDEETKTLTVFTDTSSSVDAVFINGEKQDNQKASDKTDKKKDCVSYKTNDKVDTDNESSTTAAVTDTDLQQKIKDKIQSKYNGAVMTSFDTINLSGTFSCDNIQYNFTSKDNMLEVSNINDINDVTYYKISN